MSNAVSMSYGSYDFGTSAGPIPFLTIVKTYNRADDGTRLTSRYNVTIDGVLTPLPSGSVGYQQLDSMQDALISGFATDGQNFLVQCNSQTLISEYPRVNNIKLDKSNDNWVYTTPYAIELEWDGESLSGHWVDSITETWNVEFNEEVSKYDWLLSGSVQDSNSVLLNISHSLSARGIPHHTSTGLIGTPWKLARNFVISRLGYDSEMAAQVGVLNLNVAQLSGYNHMRVTQVDETAGTYAATETWLATTGNSCGNAIEDFNVSVQFSQEEGLTSVELQGNIKGLERRTYGTTSGTFAITQTKWEAASGYWDCVKQRLLGRAKFAARAVTSREINPQPLSYSVSHFPTQGSIGYGYRYDDRPCNFISGALYENITVSDSYPTDVFAIIPILGRAYGPILQDIDTITESRRTVNIDVLMTPPTGCGSVASMLASRPSGVDEFLCEMQTQLSGSNIQLFKSQDNDSWNPKSGRYSRTVEWTFTQCGGTAPNTDFCN